MKKTMFSAAVFCMALFMMCCKGRTQNRDVKVMQDSVSKDRRQNSAKEMRNVSATEKNYLTGKISFAKDSEFVRLNPARCDGRTVYLRTETAGAFEEMRKAAEKDGIVLTVISGARSFEHQKNIWERKWNSIKNSAPKEKALQILKYSSMPGSSRHHWGTDLDLNSLENSYFESGKGLKTYKWLAENARRYGFCQVYTDKQAGGRRGYEMEKWHWSYMPLSRKMLDMYNKSVNTDDFNGFAGCETAAEVKIIDDYVNGIDSCE